MTRHLKQGMTLVELLIVLTILAGLVTAVSVSSASMQDRRRANETERQGTAIADAWSRSEGLSFVSDFGEAPNDIGKLQLLFRKDYAGKLEINGTQQAKRPDVGLKASLIRQAPAFTLLTAKVTDLPPANDTSLAGALPTTNLTLNNLPPVTLGGGWRGPYCTEKLPLSADVATDAFGGAWHLQSEDGTDVSTQAQAGKAPVTLISYAADRMKDGIPAPTDWKNRDRRFVLKAPNPTLSVDVDIDSSVDVSKLTTYVYVYGPKVTWPAIGAAADTNPTVALQCVGYAFPSNTSGLVSGKELTIGQRTVFIWSKSTDGTYYYIPPRTMNLTSGNNTLKGTLRKAN